MTLKKLSESTPISLGLFFLGMAAMISAGVLVADISANAKDIEDLRKWKSQREIDRIDFRTMYAADNKAIAVQLTEMRGDIKVILERLPARKEK